MITFVNATPEDIAKAVRVMIHERSLWTPDNPRQELDIDPKAVTDLFTSLASISHCVIINGTYLTAWMINPQWHNPREFVIQELAVVNIAEGNGSLEDVVDYYVDLSNKLGSPVMVGDLLSSRQATYGRLLRKAGAIPVATAYIV